MFWAFFLEEMLSLVDFGQLGWLFSLYPDCQDLIKQKLDFRFF